MILKNFFNVVPMVRTTAQGPPNVTSIHLVVGTAFNGSVPRVADVNSKPAWASGQWNVFYEGGKWKVVGPILGGYAATKVSAANSPVGLTAWVQEGIGTDQPVVTSQSVTAAALGQVCIVGSGANRLVYKALNANDLSVWTLLGPSGVIENEDTSAKEKLLVRDATIQTDPFSL